MSVAFSEFVVRRGERAWPALIVSPMKSSILDAGRLGGLQSGQAGSIDHAILNAVRDRSGTVQLVVFRGRNDAGTATWGFDPGLDPGLDVDLGYWLVRTQLPTYRALTKLGINLLTHIELGPREVVAFKEGTRRLLEEVVAVREAGEAAPDADRDVWILSNLTTFFEDALEPMMNEILPNRLARAEARARRQQTLT